MQKQMHSFYSLIIPVKNEASSLPQLFQEIKKAMGKREFEIIAVDDASTDTSRTTLTSLTSQTPQLKIVHFNLPQGKWAALRAGFSQAMGNIIITMDSDLQDDPSQLPKLLNKLDSGYDLVSGWRKIRHDPLYKVLISRLGNLLASTLTKQHFYDLNSPFKVYKREVLENLPNMGSMMRFSMLFAQRLGYKVCEVPINHRPRTFDKSKFGVVKYLRIIYDLILVLLLFSGSGRLTGDVRKDRLKSEKIR